MKIEKNNKLILHIGTPKTGTTALQTFLMENADVLKHYGWCYPNLKEECKGIEHLEAGWFKNGDIFYANDKYDVKDYHSINWKIIQETLLKYIDKYNVIISAEEIWQCNTEAILKNIKKMDVHFQVVVYLRRQDTYVESSWNQEIKRGSEKRSFKQYVEELPDWLYCDYYEHLQSMVEIVGKENIIVRVFEKEQMIGGDLSKDFLALLGITSDLTEFKKIESCNERIYGDYVSVRRCLNEMDKWRGFNTYMYEGTVAELSLETPSKDSYFEPDKRKEFMERYREGNEKIAIEYLGIREGKLFIDEDVSYPCTLKELTPMEESIIKTFVAMFQMEKNQVRKYVNKQIESIKNE